MRGSADLVHIWIHVRAQLFHEWRYGKWLTASSMPVADTAQIPQSNFFSAVLASREREMLFQMLSPRRAMVPAGWVISLRSRDGSYTNRTQVFRFKPKALPERAHASAASVDLPPAGRTGGEVQPSAPEPELTCTSSQPILSGRQERSPQGPPQQGPPQQGAPQQGPTQQGVPQQGPTQGPLPSPPTTVPSPPPTLGPNAVGGACSAGGFGGGAGGLAENVGACSPPPSHIGIPSTSRISREGGLAEKLGDLLLPPPTIGGSGSSSGREGGSAERLGARSPPPTHRPNVEGPRGSADKLGARNPPPTHSGSSGNCGRQRGLAEKLGSPPPTHNPKIGRGEGGLAEKLGDLPLRLAIIGDNPSHKSWAMGHYYGHPSNHMWRILRDTGIAPAEIRCGWLGGWRREGRGVHSRALQCGMEGEGDSRRPAGCGVRRDVAEWQALRHPFRRAPASAMLSLC